VHFVKNSLFGHLRGKQYQEDFSFKLTDVILKKNDVYTSIKLVYDLHATSSYKINISCIRLVNALLLFATIVYLSKSIRVYETALNVYAVLLTSAQ